LRPLDGIRVVEVASFVAAPSGGALLADLGAEVIKVEVPQGEVYRNARPSMNGYKSDFPESPAFQMDNRGKRSLALDLTRPAARGALLRVIDRADIVLTNLLPARAARFGLDDASLRGRKPALVYARLTGYGPRGPDADRPGFDYAAFWARTGFMDLMREPGQTPVWQRPGIGDHAAGISLVAGILAALRVRERTGVGQTVCVSLLQIGLYIQGNDLAASLATRQNPPRHDRTRPRNPLWNAYPTADSGWLFLVMIESDRYWPAVCRAIECEGLERDPRFDSAVTRYRNSAELVALLDAVFRSRSLVEWEKRFADFDLIWSPMREMAEVADDPQVRAMGYLRSVDHPTAGRFETMGPPFDLSETPLAADAPAPALGADGEAVLREAGLGEAEIAAALARGK
jgi:crotonobetainyl-CoA:carnitine CoA-transferase CaiB-like acyl-CoA transferase